MATIVELRDRIAVMEQTATDLEKTRDGLREEADRVDKHIELIRGNGYVKKSDRPKTVKAKPKLKRVSARVANKLSLRKHVEKALGGRHRKRGLTISELEAVVKENGYKTNSKKFKTVIYQCIYQQGVARHNKKTGKYTLPKAD